MKTDYLRIEKAIRYIEEHFQDQPSLEEVAEYIHLSPFYFQRLFSHWAGISPKRFVQFLTIEYAKKLLTQYRSVLDVTYEAGLSSPSRLYDVFVSIDAVTPGEFKKKGAGLQIDYGIHPSPFGDCLLAVTSRGICGLSFITGDSPDREVTGLKLRWKNAVLRECPQTTKPFSDQIFQPRLNSMKRSISLFLKGTNFQIKVWEALLRIPSGSICSYEDIATYIGKPNAARAVGNAIAFNPVAYIIPCHRVIRKIGVFGNYQYGAIRKKIMIGWEIAQKYRKDCSSGLR